MLMVILFDLEQLYDENIEMLSTKCELCMDLSLQIEVAVFNPAKSQMLQYDYDFIDKYEYQEGRFRIIGCGHQQKFLLLFFQQIVLMTLLLNHT